jgi:hypothetical protein
MMMQRWLIEKLILLVVGVTLLLLVPLVMVGQVC